MSPRRQEHATGPQAATGSGARHLAAVAAAWAVFLLPLFFGAVGLALGG